MISIILYFSIIFGTICSIPLRKHSLLLRSNTLFWFNNLFLIFAIIISLFIHGFTLISLSFYVIVIFCNVILLIKPVWIIFNYSEENTISIIEKTLNMLQIAFKRESNKYILSLDSDGNIIRIKKLYKSIAFISFHGSWNTRKLDLVKKLLIKNSFSFIPPLTIHLN